MTAQEMVDGKYYEQYSDAYYEALEKSNAPQYPEAKTEQLLVTHFWSVRQHLERLLVLSGLKM